MQRERYRFPSVTRTVCSAQSTKRELLRKERIHLLSHGIFCHLSAVLRYAVYMHAFNPELTSIALAFFFFPSSSRGRGGRDPHGGLAAL